MTTFGYIVCAQDGPLSLCYFKKAPAAGVLLQPFDDTGTLFPNRKSAKRAIERTDKHMRRIGQDWKRTYSIYRLGSPEQV